MAPDLQLTQLRRHHEDQDNEEDVRLLDSYDLEIGAGGKEHQQPLLFQRLHIRITGMTCAACSNSVESALTSLNGVVSASVALLQNKAEVLFDPSVLKVEDVVEAVEDAGFEAEIIPQSSTSTTTTTNQDVESTADATLIGLFSIGGMTCAACVNSVEGILRALPGVKRAVVALATSLGEVEYDSTVISKDDIVNAIEDAGFDGSLVQSNTQDKIMLTIAGVLNELDVRYLEGVLATLKGVRQFCFDRISGDLEVLFDPEVLSSRNLVDGIQSGSCERFIVRVRNPYTRMTSKDLEESTKMFRLFTSSLFLSVSVVFVLECFIMTISYLIVCRFYVRFSQIGQLNSLCSLHANAWFLLVLSCSKSHLCSLHLMQLPVIFMRVICPSIPLLYALLLWRCGPFLMGDWLKWALVSVIQFVVGKRFYVAAWRALKNGSTNMDVLVALGTSASYFYSVCALFYGAVTGFWSPTYFETSAMLITFVLLGKYLETLAKGKTSDAIKKLIELSPASALLLIKGKGVFSIAV